VPEEKPVVEEKPWPLPLPTLDKPLLAPVNGPQPAFENGDMPFFSFAEIVSRISPTEDMDRMSDAQLNREMAVASQSLADMSAEKALAHDLNEEIEEDRRLERSLIANFIQAEGESESEAESELQTESEADEASGEQSSLIEASSEAKALKSDMSLQSASRAGMQAGAKTVLPPVPTDNSQDLFFANRVALTSDGSTLVVQSLRHGKVDFETYTLQNGVFGFANRQSVPWSNQADFREGGFSMSKTGTVISMGTVNRGVAFLTRSSLDSPFVIPPRP